MQGLRLYKHEQLSLCGVVTGDEQPRKRSIPHNTRGPEARRPCAAADVRAPEDISVASLGVRCGDGVKASAGELREGHDGNLEARGGGPVPRPVQGHVQVLEALVECGADGCAVRLERKPRGGGALGACVVVKGAVGGDNELLADFEGLVRDNGRLPD